MRLKVPNSYSSSPRGGGGGGTVDILDFSKGVSP